jgi:hypothetical protein
MAYNALASLKGRMHSETRRPTFRRGDTAALESTPLLPATNGAGPPRSSGESDAPGWASYPKHALGISWEVLRSNYVNVMLVFVPLGIVAGELGWAPIPVFSLNFLAIIPLASLLSFATEELSAEMGQTIGGLCNASFGNAVELIVRRASTSRRMSVDDDIGLGHRPGKGPDPHRAGGDAGLHLVQQSSCG